MLKDMKSNRRALTYEGTTRQLKYKSREITRTQYGNTEYFAAISEAKL
jgi:hypothetical protein